MVGRIDASKARTPCSATVTSWIAAKYIGQKRFAASATAVTPASRHRSTVNSGQTTDANVIPGVTGIKAVAVVAIRISDAVTRSGAPPRRVAYNAVARAAVTKIAARMINGRMLRAAPAHASIRWSAIAVVNGSLPASP